MLLNIASVAHAAETFYGMPTQPQPCVDKNWTKPMPEPPSGENLGNLVGTNIAKIGHFGIRHFIHESSPRALSGILEQYLSEAINS